MDFLLPQEIGEDLKRFKAFIDKHLRPAAIAMV